jgi:hypothetical protein
MVAAGLRVDPLQSILAEAAVVLRDGDMEGRDCGSGLDYCPFCACMEAAYRLDLPPVYGRRAWTAFPQPLKIELRPGAVPRFTLRLALAAIGEALRGRT